VFDTGFVRSISAGALANLLRQHGDAEAASAAANLGTTMLACEAIEAETLWRPVDPRLRPSGPPMSGRAWRTLFELRPEEARFIVFLDAECETVLLAVTARPAPRNRLPVR
jgi:hypothetical protein